MLLASEKLQTHLVLTCACSGISPLSEKFGLLTPGRGPETRAWEPGGRGRALPGGRTPFLFDFAPAPLPSGCQSASLGGCLWWMAGWALFRASLRPRVWAAALVDPRVGGQEPLQQVPFLHFLCYRLNV